MHQIPLYSFDKGGITILLLQLYETGAKKGLLMKLEILN